MVRTILDDLPVDLDDLPAAVAVDGARLREARKLAGYPPRQVSRWLGVHHTTLFSWERNDRIPPGDKLLSLLLLYKLTPGTACRITLPPPA